MRVVAHPHARTHTHTHTHPRTHTHRRTSGYSGAEIEGVVKSAASHAMDRALRAGNAEDVRVGWGDFEVCVCVCVCLQRMMCVFGLT
jgi:SpoVK/Ycf46/Vps4 family AAA+-type ATPase